MVKTTVVLPDALWKAVKKQAVDDLSDMKTIMIDALTDRVESVRRATDTMDAMNWDAMVASAKDAMAAVRVAEEQHRTQVAEVARQAEAASRTLIDQIDAAAASRPDFTKLAQDAAAFAAKHSEQIQQLSAVVDQTLATIARQQQGAYEMVMKLVKGGKLR